MNKKQRKPWSSHARMKARERFWKPVNEQVGLLIDIINSGETDLDSMLYDLGTYCDSQIFGNRLNSPPFRYALIKELKAGLWMAA